jgi:hypothetical protein
MVERKRLYFWKLQALYFCFRWFFFNGRANGKVDGIVVRRKLKNVKDWDKMVIFIKKCKQYDW